ncbi:MAG: FAD-dependent pyridine nucleotide-disulfide oxidoreductase [Planctomycetota bacterium]|nr:FAD-dependent pyridine nucleotide-disulfide oxidoreductase [Planctomycetota bacterium]
MLYDALIVGGGPAGLSAALVLGRCRRRVLVCDTGQPRNAGAQAMHGYLSRDGLPPRELLHLGRVEIARYGVEFLEAEVVSVQRSAEAPFADDRAGFEVATADGRTHIGRKLLLATGVRDVLPPIEGAERYYGRGVHHCPYCDGWEHRDASLVAYGSGRAAIGLALSLRTWSRRVTACTDGRRVDPRDHARLERNGIALRTQGVAKLYGSEEVLHGILFEDGGRLDCDALFFNTDHLQRSSLPGLLGCKFGKDGCVITHGKQHTGVDGLFLAGDAAGDVQFVIVAAAEGARAAVAINRELQDEDRGEARPAPRAGTLSAFRRS